MTTIEWGVQTSDVAWSLRKRQATPPGEREENYWPKTPDTKRRVNSVSKVKQSSSIRRQDSADCDLAAMWIEEDAKLELCAHKRKRRLQVGTFSEPNIEFINSRVSNVKTGNEDISSNFFNALSHLAEVNSEKVLNEWLAALTQKKMLLPNGMPPDSPAISVAKRLLDLNFERGFRSITSLLIPNKRFPFRLGYFQVSLVGAILAKLSSRDAAPDIAKTLWEKVDYLLVEGPRLVEERALLLGLIGGQIGAALIAEEITKEAIVKIDSSIKKTLEFARSAEEKAIFIRFMGDSIGQAIDETNVSRNFPKLLAFFKYANADPDFIRPTNWFLNYMRTLVEPARTVLST